MSNINKYIENPDFCAWALGDDEKSSFWEQYLLDHPEENNSIQNAKKFVQQVQIDESGMKALDVQKLWRSIEQQTSTSSKPKQRSIAFKPWLSYAAAVVVFLFAGFFLWQSQMTSVKMVAEAGNPMQTISLPDGSEIDMNAGSSIVYDKEEWESARTVKLEGEAFFQVTKGESFEVITEQGKVTVLGTSFNVLARDTQWSVKCYTGKVKVSTEGYEDVILTAGEAVTLDKNKLLESKSEEAKAAPAWTAGIFQYEKTKLINVFQEVERQFDVEINIDQKVNQNLPFTGTFNNRDLPLALDIICKPLGYQYQIKGKTVTIFND